MSLTICVVSILVLIFTVSWIVLAPPVIKQPRSCPPTTTTPTILGQMGLDLTGEKNFYFSAAILARR